MAIWPKLLVVCTGQGPSNVTVGIEFGFKAVMPPEGWSMDDGFRFNVVYWSLVCLALVIVSLMITVKAVIKRHEQMDVSNKLFMEEFIRKWYAKYLRKQGQHVLADWILHVSYRSVTYQQFLKERELKIKATVNTKTSTK